MAAPSLEAGDAHRGGLRPQSLDAAGAARRRCRLFVHRTRARTRAGQAAAEGGEGSGRQQRWPGRLGPPDARGRRLRLHGLHGNRVVVCSPTAGPSQLRRRWRERRAGEQRERPEFWRGLHQRCSNACSHSHGSRRPLLPALPAPCLLRQSARPVVLQRSRRRPPRKRQKAPAAIANSVYKALVPPASRAPRPGFA